MIFCRLLRITGRAGLSRECRPTAAPESTGTSLGNWKVFTAALCSVVRIATRADGPLELFSAPGGASSKPYGVSVPQFLPLQGRTDLTHLEIYS